MTKRAPRKSSGKRYDAVPPTDSSSEESTTHAEDLEPEPLQTSLSYLIRELQWRSKEKQAPRHRGLKGRSWAHWLIVVVRERGKAHSAQNCSNNVCDGEPHKAACLCRICGATVSQTRNPRAMTMWKHLFLECRCTNHESGTDPKARLFLRALSTAELRSDLLKNHDGVFRTYLDGQGVRALTQAGAAKQRPAGRDVTMSDVWSPGPTYRLGARGRCEFTPAPYKGILQRSTRKGGDDTSTDEDMPAQNKSLSPVKPSTTRSDLGHPALKGSTTKPHAPSTSRSAPAPHSSRPSAPVPGPSAVQPDRRGSQIKPPTAPMPSLSDSLVSDESKKTASGASAVSNPRLAPGLSGPTTTAQNCDKQASQIRSVFERAAAKAAQSCGIGIDTETRISSLKADLHGLTAAQPCCVIAARPDPMLGRSDDAAYPATTTTTWTEEPTERPTSNGAVTPPAAPGPAQAMCALAADTSRDSRPSACSAALESGPAGKPDARVNETDRDADASCRAIIATVRPALRLADAAIRSVETTTSQPAAPIADSLSIVRDASTPLAPAADSKRIATGESQPALQSSESLADGLNSLPAIHVGSVQTAEPAEGVSTGATAAAKQPGPVESASNGECITEAGAYSAASSSQKPAEQSLSQTPASGAAKKRSGSAPPVARSQPSLSVDASQRSIAPPTFTKPAGAARTTGVQNERASKAQIPAGTAAHLHQSDPGPATGFHKTLQPYARVLQAVGILDQAALQAHIYEEHVDLWVKFMASSLRSVKGLKRFHELLDTFDKEFELAELLRECELETAPLESSETALQPYTACLAANGKTAEDFKSMKPKSIENWVRSVAMRDNTINGFPTLLNSTVKQFKLFVAIKEYLEE